MRRGAAGRRASQLRRQPASVTWSSTWRRNLSRSRVARTRARAPRVVRLRTHIHAKDILRSYRSHHEPPAPRGQNRARSRACSTPTWSMRVADLCDLACGNGATYPIRDRRRGTRTRFTTRLDIMCRAVCMVCLIMQWPHIDFFGNANMQQYRHTVQALRLSLRLSGATRTSAEPGHRG